MREKFKEYVFNNYDITDEAIKRKYEHSLRVADLCRKIGESINVKDIDTLEHIGLLHDVARFNEWITYHTFKEPNFDHGMAGANMIKPYISDENIINAVYYHNKLELPKEYANNYYCKIIRDADKVDIFKIFNDCVLYENGSLNEFSDQIRADFMNEKSIKNGDIKYFGDSVLSILAFIYDLNYDYSLRIIKDNHYLEKIYEQLNEKNKYEEYFKFINKYIEKRLSLC